MNLKINLTMDNRWFSIMIAILIIVIIYMLNYGNMNLSLITVQQYQNCSVERYPTYFPYTNSITDYRGVKDSNCCYPSNCPQAEDNPENCDCIYPVYCINFTQYENIVGS